MSQIHFARGGGGRLGRVGGGGGTAYLVLIQISVGIFTVGSYETSFNYLIPRFHIFSAAVTPSNHSVLSLSALLIHKTVYMVF